MLDSPLEDEVKVSEEFERGPYNLVLGQCLKEQDFSAWQLFSPSKGREFP